MVNRGKAGYLIRGILEWKKQHIIDEADEGGEGSKMMNLVSGLTFQS